MNKVKKNLQRLVHFFLASLLAVGSLPLNTINTYAADDEPSTGVVESSTDAPAHEKTLTPNDDGTYTVTLSVTGKASSSTIQDVTKSNVVLLIDTSSSMVNNRATGYNGTRLEAEKNALTKDDGIIDKLLANNTADNPDIIELYGINFGTGASTTWDWSTNGNSIKSAINGLTTNTGTNWEEALILAKQAADAKHATEPDENTYVIFMTDGEPTTHYNDHTVNTNFGQEWGHANDDARGIVTAGYTFYGIFTFGSGNSSSYLKSLVNYAYTGSGTYNSSLSSDYAQYFYDATDTQALIQALEAIVNEITSSVGYTNIAMTDGLTDLTSSMKVDGKISNLTYTRSGGSYGSGTVWTDAPKATTTNGTVNWNLGENVLEDGVTYSVSFVVWPSQESYDLVADLNNGKKSYDELTASQKTSIIKNTDGSYTLKTNTDFPTLTYSTITTTTSNTGTETVVSEPTTIDIENPKPVGLANEKLTLEKKWEDTLDPSQREEVNGEVVLDFYRDGKPYEQDIHLTEGNNWKLNDYISIAPGIMISNTSANYNALKAGHTEYSFDGKTYIILETGHDYYFAEEDINSHFELTNYIYHPMLVDNELKNVFFTRDASGNITGIEEFKTMDSVSATNTLKGGINIEKKVVDKNGNLIDTGDSFIITAHLVGTDAKPYSYDYRIYYGEKNPEYKLHIVYNDDGSVRYSRSEHIYGTGTLTETLYIGDVIRIVNVESGVEYYVEEAAKDGYDLNPVISYEEQYGDENNTTPSAGTTDGYYVVSGNTASNVTVTNKFLDEKTKVDFEKNWYDEDGNVLSGEDLPGSITIELFKKGADGETVSTGKTKQVTADTDWKGSFTDLPKYDNGVEIAYSVQESAIEGATYDNQREAFFEFDTVENNGKRAVLGRWKVITFEDYVLQNKWTPATESVTGRTSFNIVKVDKTTGEPLSGVTFELKLKNGATVTATTNTEGKATFSNLDSGEYTLKETSAPEGYKLISAEPSINITSIKKLNNVDLDNLKNFYEYVFSFSVSSQVDGYEYDVDSRTFTVKNEPVPYGDIIASKVWDDDGDRDGLRKNYANHYVAVKNNNGKYVAYEKLMLENKDDYKFTHLPLKTADGEDISYTIVEASTCSGSGKSVKCTEFDGDDDYMVTIEDGVITNAHEPELYNETGDLTVKKLWAGVGNDLARPGSVTVELLANGDVIDTADIVAGQNNKWSHTFTGLYLNEGGEPIQYSVQESAIGKTGFEENSSIIIVYAADGETIDGKWEKNESGFEVTNTWTKATDKIEYNGANKFYIKKVDENYEPMEGVTFAVEGATDRQTDTKGMTSKSVPVSTSKKEESFEFVVSEKETLEGYDLVEGSATVAVTCTSKLTRVDEATLTNTYTKTCNFEKGGSSEYVWNSDTKTMVVTNYRSLAASLVIRKEISGVTGAALRENNLKFTLTGPEDFGAKEISFSEFTKIEDGVYEYNLTGKIPTGEYKVVESGAEFEGLLTLTVTGDNDKALMVAKDDEVEFTIKNSYEKIRDVHYKVAKIWEDDGDRDGLRPDELEITLLRDGAIYRNVVLTADDWAYEWTDLPRAGEDATEYVYTVVEEDLSNYDSDGGKMVDGVFTFTNTHEPELIKEDDEDPDNDGKLKVEKTWDDEDNLGNTRPASITVELLADDEVIEVVDILPDEYGNWEYEFEGLYKYDDGVEIEYVINEIVVENYDTLYEQNGYDFVIRNSITDPCLIGGCGGDIIPPEIPETPETGKFTTERGGRGGAIDNAWVIATMGTMAIMSMAGAVVFAKRRK
ncbi:MAG: Cna B-type domain-containing protein [Candidatus Saccharibacteria bacterium]|nr:Cna B-type domain-containing protein [Candidatus Saccharibacteria bacterium]